MECKRSSFLIDPEVTYLNCAYQSPLSNQVISYGQEGLLKKANPQNIKSDDFFSSLEVIKKKFAKLIQTDDPQRIAYHPSASYGFAIVANNLAPKKNGKILMPSGQFPSNYYAFESFAEKHNARIEFIKAPEEFEQRGKKWNERILEAIDEQTICITLDHTHWQDGTIFNLREIRKKCDQCDALMIVDGTQSIGALPFNCGDLKPDALICAGYKFLMGPYGSALAYYGDYFDQGNPIEHNWINRYRSEDFSSLISYQKGFREKAFRYNVGEFSNFIHMAMLGGAINQLLEWTPSSIQDYCRSISNDFFDIVKNKGYKFDAESQARHLFGIYTPQNVDVNILNEKLQKAHIYVSFRGNAIRISPHVYNNREELLKLASLL
ncbi:MAG: aminotransferase class V-fold PLP-dependent enzyme [Saprospiraceae bacterium]|nr:aminotransferase class V-fold PLP-dependent enzyme [Saprospiraceae bacterium]